MHAETITVSSSLKAKSQIDRVALSLSKVRMTDAGWPHLDTLQTLSTRHFFSRANPCRGRVPCRANWGKATGMPPRIWAVRREGTWLKRNTTTQHASTKSNVQEQTCQWERGSSARGAQHCPLSRTGYVHRRQTPVHCRRPQSESRCRRRCSFCLQPTYVTAL